MTNLCVPKSGEGPRARAAPEADPEHVDREAITHASTRHPAEEVAWGEAPGTADRDPNPTRPKTRRRIDPQRRKDKEQIFYSCVKSNKNNNSITNVYHDRPDHFGKN